MMKVMEKRKNNDSKCNVMTEAHELNKMWNTIILGKCMLHNDGHGP